MTRRIMAALAAAALLVSLTGCAAAEKPAASTPAPAPSAKVAVPTKDAPMVVDKQNKAVLVYAEVNRKWVTEPTRHAVVTAAGSNAMMAIFRAGGDALDLNKALFELGGTAGENVKKDSPAGTQVEGSALDITVSWDGKEYPIDDLIASTGEFGGKALTPKFGGNAELQSTAKTGCLFCLDSCAAGITSNSTVGWKSFDNGKVEFRGIGDKLPADGAPVTIRFALK